MSLRYVLRRLIIREYALIEDIIHDLESGHKVHDSKLRSLHRKLVRLSAHVHDEQFKILYRKLMVDLPSAPSIEQYRAYEKDLQSMLAFLKQYKGSLRLRDYEPGIPKPLLHRLKNARLIAEKQNVLYGFKQLAKRGYTGGYDFVARSIWDVLDNLEYPDEPLQVEASTSTLLQYVRGMNELFHYADGVWRMKEVAGRLKEKTQHAHYNFLIRDGITTTLLFIDPEHHVGTWGTGRDSVHNLLRPPIVNLFEITCRGEQVVRMNIIRFQSFDNVAPKVLFKPAQTLSERIPCKPNHVLFRLSLQKDRCIVQSRYCSERTLQDFLQGRLTDPYLKNKIHSFESWLKRAVHGEYKR